MRAVAQLLLLAALPALAGRAGGEVVVSGAGPAFVAGGAARALAAARGQHVELQCSVLRLGDRAISWVRSRDLQILSHAGAVFTADARVAVLVQRPTEAGVGGVTRHTLSIQRLRLRDAGRYECQLNTEPKMSLFFNLTVIDEVMPRVVVEAEQAEVSGAVGGAASLVCGARYEPPPRHLPLPPLAVLWAKDGRPLTAQENLGRGIWVQSESSTGRARSRLTLGALGATDAGRYTCSAAGVTADVLLLLHTESPVEAMQRDQSADDATRGSCLAALSLLLALVAPRIL